MTGRELSDGVGKPRRRVRTRSKIADAPHGAPTEQDATIADLLGMPEAADIEFEAPRLRAVIRPPAGLS